MIFDQQDQITLRRGMAEMAEIENQAVETRKPVSGGKIHKGHKRKIMDLMCDRRERTMADISLRTGIGTNSLPNVLSQLVRSGVLEREEISGAEHKISVWRTPRQKQLPLAQG